MAISLQVLLTLMLSLVFTSVSAQGSQNNTLPDSTQVMCLVNLPTASAHNFAMPTTLTNPNSLVSCGSGALQAYFADVDVNSKLGFDDPTYGADRRACACAVLSYITQVAG